LKVDVFEHGEPVNPKVIKDLRWQNTVSRLKSGRCRISCRCPMTARCSQAPIARKFRKPDASVQRDIHELSHAVPATC
jgi:hypothetical protein